MFLFLPREIAELQIRSSDPLAYSALFSALVRLVLVLVLCLRRQPLCKRCLVAGVRVGGGDVRRPHAGAGTRAQPELLRALRGGDGGRLHGGGEGEGRFPWSRRMRGRRMEQ